MVSTSSTNDEFKDDIPTLIPENIKSHKQFNLGVELMAGTLAGVTSCVIFYPLECIEAKLQVMSSTSGAKKSDGISLVNSPTLTSSNKKAVKFQPKTPIETAKYIYRYEGLKGFYQGLSPTVLGNAVNWGIYFAIYRSANHWWDRESGYGSSNTLNPAPAWVGHSFSAISAGLVTTAVVNPFWVLKIRLATTPHKYPHGMVKATQTILRTEGVSAFWKGVSISFLGVSEGLVQFVSYEWLLNSMRNSMEQDLTMSNYLIAGGTARLIAGLITYPYLLIRSTLQAEGCPYNSMTQVIRSINKNEGISGFYQGLAPNLIRSIPPAAFMLYIVEFFRSSLTNLFL